MSSKGKTARRGRKISEARFRALWLDPMVRSEDIAALLDITPSAVRFRAKARGLGRKPLLRDKRITDPEFPALYLGGVSGRDLCALYGCTHPRLHRTADRLGLPRRNLRGRKELTLAQYREVALQARMKAAARAEQAALARADMVDVLWSCRRAMGQGVPA